MIDTSEAGRALGRLGLGKKKTMTKAAFKQRKAAAKKPRKRKLKIIIDSTKTLP